MNTLISPKKNTAIISEKDFERIGWVKNCKCENYFCEKVGDGPDSVIKVWKAQDLLWSIETIWQTVEHWPGE